MHIVASAIKKYVLWICAFWYDKQQKQFGLPPKRQRINCSSMDTYKLVSTYSLWGTYHLKIYHFAKEICDLHNFIDTKL